MPLQDTKLIEESGKNEICSSKAPGMGENENFRSNKAQEAAVRKVTGQMILIACPGSGKTTTLLRRIRHMIVDEKIPAGKILMITFTKAAATHMREQYEKMYGSSRVTFSTIHSICFATLRKFCGVTGESVLQETEAREFLYELIRRNRDINDKDDFITDFLNDLTVMRNNRMESWEYKPKCCEDETLFRDLTAKYEQFKKENNKIDFDDMLTKTADLLETNETIRDFLRGLYQYIQVDEYQDTNYVQRDIVYMLAGKNGNLAVVGDDDQSIYGFRGAHPEIMLEFRKAYPEAETIYLDTNYRSGSEIIRQAGALIANNKERFDKRFNGDRDTNGRVKVLTAADRKGEIAELTAAIKEKLGQGVPPEEIAVLYRNNRQANATADALMEAGMEFTSNEPLHSRYEHWIWRDILAYHRLAVGEGDERDLALVLNHPNRYLDRNVVKAGLDLRAMEAAVYSDDKPYWQVSNARKKISEFFSLLGLLKKASPKQTMEALEFAGEYQTYLEQYAEYRHDDAEELKAIWYELKEDAAKASDFDNWAALSAEYKGKLRDAAKVRRGITLSTMHRAKGLEWDTVFIIDAVDGICPYAESKTKEEKEEERRLFYVAMTRAKNDLCIMNYKEGGKSSVEPSPYLREIEQNLKNQEKVTRETAIRGVIRKLQDESIKAEIAGKKVSSSALAGLTEEETKILSDALGNYLRMQSPDWKPGDLVGVAKRETPAAAKARVKKRVK